MTQEKKGFICVSERDNENYINIISPQRCYPFNYNPRCGSSQCECKECNTTVNITNSITVTQEATPSAGGGGTGGTGGDGGVGGVDTGGDGGSGGAGGTGGDADATNTATAEITNVFIIPCGGSSGNTANYKLGTDGKTVDVKVDKDGNAYVNGKKVDKDDSNVFIFKNTETKNKESKD